MKELKGIRKDVVWVDEPTPLSEKALEAFHKTVTEYPWQRVPDGSLSQVPKIRALWIRTTPWERRPKRHSQSDYLK